MSKILKLLLVGAMAIQMTFAAPATVRAATNENPVVTAATSLELDIRRSSDNVVTLNWNAVDGAVSYNVYDTPYGAAEKKLNTTPITATTFVAKGLDSNKVHTLKVKAVNELGVEFTISNTKKVGITEKVDLSNGVGTLEKSKDKLNLPVSDLAENLDYVGPTIQDDKYHYWCYSSVTDENGKIHLFMSRVPKDTKFIPGWKTKSEIAHFVGDSSEGPFTEVGTPFAPGTLPDGQWSAHNPRIKKVDGKYVLLYIVRYDFDNGKEGSQATCMATIDKLPTEPGSDTIDKWNLVTEEGTNNKNGVIIRYGVKAVNPDMFKVKDEKGNDEYVMYFKGNVYPDRESAPYFLYYATSSKLEGPYKFQGKATDATTTIEDPSVFRWKDKYFMLTYDLGNGISGTGKSVGMIIPSRTPYMFSFKDAWISAGVLSDYIKMPQGFTHAYSGQDRMERPYIVFENDKPKYFIGTNSADVNGNNVTQSYTFKFNDLPKHALAIDENIKGGKIEVSAKKAEVFDDIIIKVTPEEGYELAKDSIVVTSKDAVGNSYTSKVETLEDGTYRFMMPSGDAAITARFKKAGHVDRVEITPNTTEVIKGQTHNFFASVLGSGDWLKTVDWSVEGGNAKTTISKDGVLSVDAAETAKTLTVKAVSKEDPTKFATATVTLLDAGSNLALGLDESCYLASSFHRNGPGTVVCNPKNAFDGITKFTGAENLNQIWTPKADDPKPWLGVNFKEPKEFNTVKLYDYPNATTGRLKTFDIEVSDDGVKWDKVASFTFSGEEEVKVCKLPNTVKKQYVRAANQVTTKDPLDAHVVEMEVCNDIEVKAPVITVQPKDQKVALGKTATFVVEATGSEKLTYQWQVSKDNGETWEVIPNAVSKEYTTGELTAKEDGYLYRCIVTNMVNSVASDAAVLTVGCEHEWDENFTVDKAPTCTEEGSQSKHCKKCGEVKDVQTIPALGHDYDENGKCTICGEQKWFDLEPSEPIKPSIPWTPLEPSTPVDPDNGTEWTPLEPSKPVDKEEKPDTGDKTSIGYVATTLALAAAGMVLLRKKKED